MIPEPPDFTTTTSGAREPATLENVKAIYAAVVTDIHARKMLPRRQRRRLPNVTGVTWGTSDEMCTNVLCGCEDEAHPMFAGKTIGTPRHKYIARGYDWTYLVHGWLLTTGSADDLLINVLHEIGHIVTSFLPNDMGHSNPWRRAFARLLVGFNMDAKFYAKYNDLTDPYLPDGC